MAPLPFTHLRVLQLMHRVPFPYDSVLKLCTRCVRVFPFYFPATALFELSMSTHHAIYPG